MTQYQNTYAKSRAAISQYEGLIDRELAEALGPIDAEERKLQTDRENYAAWVQDRVENGCWTPADVKEYRDEVKRIMKEGEDDEKAAASEFWANKREVMIGSAKGINDRIRADLETKKKAPG